MSGQGQSPYAAASRAPLIKSPSLHVPAPVEMPPDIHPLPDSVIDYFVYPFTLEPHIITLESSRRATLAAHAVRREAYLRTREEEKERRKREALKRIAPGFEPQGGLLVPTKRFSTDLHADNGSGSHSGSGPDTPDTQGGHNRTKSVMDDLVEHLAKLESGSS
ncbi:hypothetical protein QCA50_011813 [Cerrena zonata]|uniref:Uncharacterized protein n=1 Tax=Cerrena zonata TaxID=2478898 RepID=A0AAW0G4T7_9APHY